MLYVFVRERTSCIMFLVNHDKSVPTSILIVIFSFVVIAEIVPQLG